MEHIMEYEKLVCKIASKYSYFSDFEDLKQVGMIGLMRAVEKYVPNPNTKFSTYATEWIRGSILEYLNIDKNIRVSKELLSLRKKIDACCDILRQKLEREPSISEISFFLEEDENKVVEALATKDLVLSSDYIVNQDDDGKGVNLYDTVPYYESGYDDDVLTLKCALENLTDDEKNIIDLRYYRDMTQSEVSKMLGTNQVSISRSESKILQKLKKEIAA